MNQRMMKTSEGVRIDEDKIYELQLLVSQGEGNQLEFKRKATHPDKVVRELIAFANMNGGVLLIGVDDDRSIPGVKYPEEEMMGIHDVLEKCCRPPLLFHETILALANHKFVVRLDIEQSEKRPHYYLHADSKETYVRFNDMSIKATAEMEEIVRRKRKKKDMLFTYGEEEHKLMKYLEDNKTITFTQFRELTGLNRFKASRKLILLVLANVLKIEATEKGDLYSRA